VTFVISFGNFYGLALMDVREKYTHVYRYSNLTYGSPAFAPYRTLTIRKNRTMKKKIAIGYSIA